MVTAVESRAFNRRVIEEFRACGGKVGGRHAGLPLLLLTSTGAHTGLLRTVPLTYLADRDRYVVAAGAAGANPAWYHNVLARPAVTIEVGTAVFDALAWTAVRAERDVLFQRFTADQPQLLSYQAESRRQVPMIVLTPIAPGLTHASPSSTPWYAQR